VNGDKVAELEMTQGVSFQSGATL